MKPVITRVVQGGRVSLREKTDPKDGDRGSIKIVRVLPNRKAIVQAEWVVGAEQVWSILSDEDAGFGFAVGKITCGPSSSVTLKWLVPENTIVDRNARQTSKPGSDSDRGRGPSPRTA